MPRPLNFSHTTWITLAASVGLTNTRQLATRPSRFLYQIYSALSTKQ